MKLQSTKIEIHGAPDSSDVVGDPLDGDLEPELIRIIDALFSLPINLRRRHSTQHSEPQLVPSLNECRGEIWHFIGTVAGRRLRGSTKTSQKAEAERIANEAESRYLQGRRDPGSILTFAQAAIQYRKVKGEPRFLEMVEDYWKDTAVKDITRGALRRAAIELLPNGSGAYRNRAVLTPTMAVINHAAELELCPPMRVRRLPEPRKHKEPATWEWIEAFMAHASPHLGWLACFMFLTGARVSEALGVRCAMSICRKPR